MLIRVVWEYQGWVLHAHRDCGGQMGCPTPVGGSWGGLTAIRVMRGAQGCHVLRPSVRLQPRRAMFCAMPCRAVPCCAVPCHSAPCCAVPRRPHAE